MKFYKILHRAAMTVSLAAGLWLASLENNITIGGIIVLGLLLSVPCFFVIMIPIWLVMEYRRRVRLGIDVTAILETDPRKVKDRMLYVMQYGHECGIVGAMEEFSANFRNYPQWELKDWEVFRAWYKAEIDRMLQAPEIYILTIKEDRSPYLKEKDPLYDPNALDWEQFDRPRPYYDDESEEYEEYEYWDEPKESRLKKAAKDGLMMGIGFGIVNFFINGSSGGSSGGNS